MAGKEILSLPPIPRYKVAAIQYAPTLFEKEKNLLDQLELVEEAAGEGAKLIVLVEMATSAYCFYSRAEIAPYVEPIPGATTQRFGQIAQKYHIYIVIGMPEVDPDTNIYYNSLAVVGPKGLVGVYRKTHSYISENKWSKDGDLGLPVFDTEIGKIGGVICMDASFPETVRLLALRGADVVCFPTNWLKEKAPAPAWMTRAFENGVYLIAADRWGNERTVEFSGGSAIIDPNGSIQSYQDTDNGIVYGEVDIAKARSKTFQGARNGNKLLERHPQEYMGLVHNTHLFNPGEFFGLYGKDPLPQGKRSVVGVLQMKAGDNDSEANLNRIAQLLESACGCDIVVLPELAITGMVRTKEEARRASEQVERGATVDALARLAKQRGHYLATSIVESDRVTLYHTGVLVGPEGLVGKYRKLHLSESDKSWASPGDLGLPVFDIPVGRVGLQLGHDAMFFEPARCLAVQGADLICVPSALTQPRPRALGATRVPHPTPIPTGPSEVHWHLLRSRSEENCAFVAFANYCGGVYFGRSGVFGRMGDSAPIYESVAAEDKEEVVWLTMDTSQLDGSPYPTNPVRAKDMVRMRQTYWYGPLVHPGRR